MSWMSIAEQTVAMIVFVLLSKVLGHVVRKVQAMPDTKKKSLMLRAAIALPLAANCIALFFSARMLYVLIRSPDPLARVDVFLISLFTLTTFQLFWAIWFGEATRSRFAHLTRP
jgi:hypothetical protein